MPRLAPPSTSSPIPVARSRSIRAQSAGAEQVIIVPRLLLDPAEGRDVVIGAEQDARLARPGLGRQIGLPLEQVVRVLGEPARHVRCVPVAHRAPQHRQREPVDLQEDDPRARRSGVAPPCRRAMRWTTRSVYVSSSLAENTTSRTTLTAATTIAASSAHQNESTVKLSSTSSAICSSEGVQHQREQEAEARA